MKSFAQSIFAAIAITAGFSGSGKAETIPERLIADLQEDLKLTEFQAAGVAGNLARETGNFRYMQELNPLVRNSRGGIGYSQWTGSRREAYEAWAGDRDLTQYQTNYGFLLEEMTGQYRSVTAKLKQTDTQAEATRIFMNGFLRPHPKYAHLDERIAYANAYLSGDFSGAGCQSTHELQIKGRNMMVKLCDNGPAQISSDVENALLTIMLEEKISVQSDDLSFDLQDGETRPPNEYDLHQVTFDGVTEPFAGSYKLVINDPLAEPDQDEESVALDTDAPNMG